MKIKRFENINESKSSDWTENKFQKFYNLIEKIESMKSELKNYLAEYLFLNPQIQDYQEEIKEDEIIVSNFKLYSNLNKFSLEFTYVPNHIEYDDCDAYIDSEQFKDFLNFLQELESYKSAKKYNL